MARGLSVCILMLTLALVIPPARAADDVKTVGDVEAFFKKLDANHDGRVNKAEFLRLADRFKDKAKARQRLASVYDRLDMDQKGITAAQLKTYLDSNRKK